MATEYDDERALREIDEAHYSKLAEFEKNNKVMSEIEFIEDWLKTFIKVVGCSCCYSHEFKLRERLKMLKNGN